jgi:putative transposase
MDGCRGLWSAIDEVYALVPHQLCWVHKLRNVAKYCPKRYRQSCTKQAAKIMYAQTSGMAAKLFRQWKAGWINLIPKAVECLERDAYAFIRISINSFLSSSSLQSFIRLSALPT